MVVDSVESSLTRVPRGLCCQSRKAACPKAPHTVRKGARTSLGRAVRTGAVRTGAQVLSAGNMRLKLGEPTEASALYAKLDALSMTPRQQEMAHTKRRMSADLEAAQ